jgi:hypothetical protein
MAVAAAFVALAAVALTRVDPTRREDDALTPGTALASAA